MEFACKSCAPEKCFINKFCSVKSLKKVEQEKCIIRYKKGQYIFREGDLVQGIYIIYSGKVKVLSTGFNEKTQIIRLTKAGYLLGHRGFGDKYYLISAVALEDSVLCFMEANTFTELLKSDTELTYQLMLFYANELRIAESRMKNLAQMTVREKSAESLLLLKEVFGMQISKEIVLDSFLTRRDMAELAGLSPEQITRCFSEFRKDKIIRIDGKRITILQPENLYRLIAPYYPHQIFNEKQPFDSVLQ